MTDNPDFDGTEGAHPAFWRGHHHGAAGVTAVLADALDGRLKPGRTFADPTLQRAVNLIWTVRAAAPELSEAYGLLGRSACAVTSALLPETPPYPWDGPKGDSGPEIPDPLKSQGGTTDGN
jgi:hypothetical protein